MQSANMRWTHWREMVPVLACLVGAMLSSLGMVVQKAAHKNMGPASSRPYFLQPKWIAGFALYCSGDFTLFMTLWYLPQAVVAVLGTWTLVANFGFAAVLLQEKIDTKSMVATVLIIVGTSTALSAYRAGSNQYTVSELQTFVNQSPFEMFVVLIIALLVGDLMWLLLDAQPRSILIKVAKYGVMQRNRSRSFSYTLAASIVNTLVMLLGKCVAALSNTAVYRRMSVLRLITSGGGTFFFIFIACGVVCVLNVHLVNKALENGDALFVVPLYFVLGLCFKVVSGLLFFQDYLYMSNSELVTFVTGCIINVFGVYVLARRGIQDYEPSHNKKEYEKIESYGGASSEGGNHKSSNPQLEIGQTEMTEHEVEKNRSNSDDPSGVAKRPSSVSLFGFNVL